MKENTKLIAGITSLFAGQLAVNVGIHYSYKVYVSRTNTKEQLANARVDIQREDRKHNYYHWRPLTKRITNAVSLW